MYLGLNLSHDASAALINENGQILYAVGEERISRIKNHIGIPRLAIAEIIKETKDVDIDTVVCGSHQMLQPKHLDTFLAQEAGNPSSPRRKALSPFLRYSAVGVKNVMENPKKIHEFLVNEFPELVGTTPKFVRHHDSHVGCALSLACDRDTLIISLDGSGDGESGVIALFKSKTAGLITLSRISELDSLGLLYSAVTANYNFKPTHHEGKITGLAAFGQDAILTHKLEKYVRSKNGQVKLVFAKTKFTSRLLKLLEKSGFNTSKANSLDDIITKVLSTSIKYEYPDLAFAVQEVLETTVCKMVAYWVTQTNVSQVALTGGVFANVKLNQRITEVPGVRFVKVFPNMGDGGIAIGSVWSHMNTNGFNFESNLVSSMDLGTPFDSKMRTSSNLKAKKTEYPEGIIHKVVADKIIEGKVVAVLNGRMEFSPRTLGNTSILLDPRDPSITKVVNSRLKRTEFMPFAPSVLEEDLANWFVTLNHTLQPFEYMTMTCDVRADKRNLVSAITHVDGTARPQIVSNTSNKFLYQILNEFKIQTGIPILVNTSLNIDEEPIIRNLDSALNALERGAIDDLFTNNAHYTFD